MDGRGIGSGSRASSNARDTTDHLERAHHAAVARLAMLALSPSTSLPDLVRRAITELLELVPASAAATLELEDGELETSIAAGRLREGRRLTLTGSLCEEALRRGEMIRTDDLSGDPLLTALVGDERIGPTWVAPLGAFRELRLLVCVGAPEAADNPVAAASVEAIAAILAGAAERRTIEAEVRATEQRFRRLAEHVPDAVFRFELVPNRRMQYVSPRMAELTGLSAEELQDPDWSWQSVVLPDDRDVVEGLDLTVDEVVTTEPYRIVRPDSTVRWVESRFAAEYDGEGRVVAVTGLSRDITAQREAGEAIRRTLAAEQQATERLRALSELKNAMLAAVSHELRTPLTAVMGFAEVLRATGDALDPSRRDSALAALERNAYRLERLLSDLLDLDRLDRGVVEPARHPVDLAVVLDDIVAGLEHQDEGLGIEVRCPPRIVHVDPAKFERIVENLVGNAIKHTPPESRVWVRTQDRDGGLLLTVEDDGPGIPDALKTAVFEPFERGTAASPVPGTGIGLSLVRRFAELHGGRAWVEDRPGGGATFAVWLPDQGGGAERG